jgi:DNA-binding winged helix-turn-helix (wHTH) protein/TolB-like protein
MEIRSAQTVALNGVTADFGSETLRDKSGATIDLRPQAFAVLRYLVEHAGRLVTKDELMEAVWPGLSVTDDSLVQCIHEIRRALRDDEHTVLKTVPKRGYRLDLPTPPSEILRRLPSADGRMAGPLALRTAMKRWNSWPARRSAHALSATLLVIGVALIWWSLAQPAKVVASFDGPPVVALVPFINVSGDAASETFALGMKKTYFQALVRVRDIRPVNRSSAFAYGAASADALAVDLVLGGSVQHEGDRLRITSSLLDARTGDLLWSELWDRPDSNPFAVQSEICSRIASELGGRAGAILAIGRAAAHRKEPGELTAYDLYLLGTEKLDRMTRADVETAIALLDRSVEREPGLARAWIELAAAHELMANFGVEPDAHRGAAADAARRAIDLDPRDPRAHIALGESLRRSNDLARSRSAFHTALTMAPGAAETLILYPGWAATFGEPERGADVADRVAKLLPNIPMAAAEPFAYGYFMAGRYEQALDMIERLTADNYTLALWAMHAAALAAVGRKEEARAWVARAIAARPDLSIEAMANAPGYSEPERLRLVETMQLAGFPSCAGRKAVCAAHSGGTWGGSSFAR